MRPNTTDQPTSGLYEYGEACDLAASSDEVYVVSDDHPGELQVFGIDGKPRRVLRGDFCRPIRVATSHENLYVLEAISHESEETYNEWHGRRLVVLDLHGATKQVVHLDAEELIGVTAHGDEVYLSVPMPQALSCLDCFRLVMRVAIRVRWYPQ